MNPCKKCGSEDIKILVAGHYNCWCPSCGVLSASSKGEEEAVANWNAENPLPECADNFKEYCLNDACADADNLKRMIECAAIMKGHDLSTDKTLRDIRDAIIARLHKFYCGGE